MQSYILVKVKRNRPGSIVAQKAQNSTNYSTFRCYDFI
ncbi:hypothetical protein JIMMER1_55 [Brevibacillus phage Jimmer1]|uniref:Uncharacterized protein n=3 Tax=Jimmervirus TaxID=1984788 RepID=S5MTV2_9CAUD|nr:hypothetical protein AXJ21_gp055 [Brevibacillus phage Jimmer1]YP_009606482.1 hypothetical protein FDI01_gp055 [Brevibacillus phage Jimmer2]AGR47247.1 hypothetical protein JIMMER2_55 [Brevibacillus phage Jimmer2]AGR47343.1 hypothetical protein JIMMER1_55 [Brevibacillus phage Jimmer1]ALA48067.1 hypothetical protein POWDER_57 [Brevibacillus phage Powder]